MSDPQITHPQQFLPSALAAGESYAGVAAILECDDLPQVTLHIPYWRIGGKPAAIRVRALSLSERDRVLRETEVVAQYCLVMQIACVVPTFTEDQANRLADKNAFAVEPIVQMILRLGALREDWIEHVVAIQTAAPAPQAAADRGGPGDPAPHPRTRRMDRPTHRKVRAPARGAVPDA